MYLCVGMLCYILYLWHYIILGMNILCKQVELLCGYGRTEFSHPLFSVGVVRGDYGTTKFYYELGIVGPQLPLFQTTAVLGVTVEFRVLRTTQQYLHVANYNGRTLRLNHHLTEPEVELSRISWSILGLSEVQRDYILTQYTWYSFYYTRKNNVNNNVMQIYLCTY